MSDAMMMPWRDTMSAINWIGTRDDGGALGRSPSIRADKYTVRLLCLPTEATTRLDGSSDRILIGVAGEVELGWHGQSAVLGQFDLIGVPGGLSLVARDLSAQTAVLCEISSRRELASEQSPRVRTWAEQRRTLNTDYPDADLPGFHRGTYPRMQMGDVTCNLVMQPSGQTSPRHGKVWDCVFVQLRGETAFDVAGETHSLRARDVLFVPAGRSYRYTNIGSEVALFASVAGALSPGMKATYHDLRPR